jgi:hypothetical protein
MNFSPETKLFSLGSDTISLFDLIIQVENQVIHASPFHLGSKLIPCNLQEPFKLPHKSLTDPIGEDVADFFISWE